MSAAERRALACPPREREEFGGRVSGGSALGSREGTIRDCPQNS